MNDDHEDQPQDPPPPWAHRLPSGTPETIVEVRSDYQRRHRRNRGWWKKPLPPPANDDPPVDIPGMDWKPLSVGRLYCRTHLVMEFYPADNPGGNRLRGWAAYRRHPKNDLHLGDFPTREDALNACLRDFQQTGANL
jgi:hypothetical protein